MKNYPNFNKITLISGLITAIAAVGLFLVPVASASAYSGSYGSYGHGSSYGHSYQPTYYPTTHDGGSHGSSQSSSQTVIINNNTQPAYYSQPVVPVVVYSQPTYAYAPSYPSYPTYPSYPVYTTPTYAPTYYQDYAVSAPLSATCSANQTFAPIGTMVLWTASVTGGSGYYTYQWSGSDQIYGSNVTANVAYNTPGTKYAAVTIYSNGQTLTANCSNTVTVGTQIGAYNGSSNGYAANGGLNVGCAADVSIVDAGTPVTWSVEATGGTGSYTYSWTGTDGLSGSQTSISTSYETLGSKSASVTVTSSNGQSVTQACVSSVNVVPAGTPVNNGLGRANTRTNLALRTNDSGNANSLAASSIFSLGNIPWAWVAVLIILVLFGTVLYLLFNKHKI